MNKSILGVLRGTTAVVLVAACMPSAIAQSSPAVEEANTPEDNVKRQDVIVVTARRRDENLQDVPLAISNFSAESMDEQQVDGLMDLSGMVPNLNLTNITSPTTAIIYLRGAGQDDTNPPSEQPITVYLDGVPYVKAPGAIFDLIDMERVEVLRGPQGTLYGRNSTGGAIKLVSRRPSLTDSRAILEGTVGSFDRLDLSASFSTPITDTFAVKLDVMSRSQEGFIKDALSVGDGQRPERYNDTDRQTIRAGFLWAPSERLTIYSSVDSTTENSGPVATTPALDDSIAANYGPNGFIQSPDLYGDPYLAAPTMFRDNEFSSAGGMLNIEYDFDFASLETIIGYREFSVGQGTDTDAGPTTSEYQGQTITRAVNDFDFVRDWDHDTVTIESKLASNGDGKLNWVGGVFLMREHNDALSVLGRFTDPASISNPQATGEHVDQVTESVAVYGEASYDITDRIELTAGLRYTRDNKDISREATPVFGYPAFFGLQFDEISTDVEFEKVTPRFIVDVDITDDISVYGSASRGFQSGAFQGFALSPGFALVPIAETVVDSYEVGLRSTWLDNRITANVTAFEAQYSDTPTSAFTASDSGFLEAATFDATIRGLEFDLSARPTHALSLYASFAVTDTEVPTDDPDVAPPLVPGQLENSIKYTSPFNGRFGGTYTFDLSDDRGALVFGANVTRQAEFQSSFPNNPFTENPAYTLVGAQVEYQFPDDRLSVTFGGRNLSDEIYQIRSSAGGGGARTYGPPRTWYLTTRFQF